MTLDDIAVLIPYRYQSDHQHRMLGWVVAEWKRLGVPVAIGHDDTNGQPFNLSRAVNRAVSVAHKPKLVVYGADHVPDLEALERASDMLEHYPWWGVYAATAALTHECTMMLLDDDPTPVALATHAEAPFCTGIIAAQRNVWLDCPMDERFTGWGSEDVAHRVALTTLYGTPPPGVGTLYAMWHEAADKSHFAANNVLLGEYLAADGDKAAMMDVITHGAPTSTPWGRPLGGVS